MCAAFSFSYNRDRAGIFGSRCSTRLFPFYFIFHFNTRMNRVQPAEHRFSYSACWRRLRWQQQQRRYRLRPRRRRRVGRRGTDHTETARPILVRHTSVTLLAYAHQGCAVSNKVTNFFSNEPFFFLFSFPPRYLLIESFHGHALVHTFTYFPNL